LHFSDMDYFEWALKLTSKHLKPSSQAVYASMWSGFRERLAVAGTEPGKESLTQLANALQGAGDYVTQKRLHSLVHWVYDTLLEAGLPLTDHTEELERLYKADARAQHEGLSLEDLAQLEEAATVEVRGWKGARLAAMVSVLAHAGLRRQELLTLERTSVSTLDDGSGLLVVGRSRSQRKLTLPPECMARIQQWLSCYPAPDDCRWLFVADAEGSQMDGSTVWRQLKRLCARVLGEDAASQFGTGIIRASLAKARQEEGLSPTELREFLGHRMEASTAELLERVKLPTVTGRGKRSSQGL
jgi:site-specific recombinase XerD